MGIDDASTHVSLINIGLRGKRLHRHRRTQNLIKNYTGVDENTHRSLLGITRRTRKSLKRGRERPPRGKFRQLAEDAPVAGGRTSTGDADVTSWVLRPLPELNLPRPLNRPRTEEVAPQITKTRGGTPCSRKSQQRSGCRQEERMETFYDTFTFSVTQ